jgi:putative hemolysin
MSPWTEFLLIVGLILVNGVFAGAEIAIVALRTSRLRELADGGSRAAKSLMELRSNPERFLSTIQVVITVVGAAAAAFGGAAFAQDLSPLVAKVSWLAGYSDEIALGLVVTIISFLSLLLGELVPKSLALRASERYALIVVRPLLALSWALTAPVWVLTSAANLVLRVFGDRTTFMESRISLEELRSIVGEAKDHGAMPPHAGAIASRALEFAELTAGDVMVHRSLIVGLSKRASDQEISERVLAAVHQRYPVYEGSLDNVVGYVSWRDILPRVSSGQPLVLDELIRPTVYVPQSQPAPTLLEDMRKRRLHLAVVVDEHGGTAGLITLEDLLEELVGEITSEHSGLEHESISRQPDGSALVAAPLAIRDANRELQLQLQEPEHISTLGGLCVLLAHDHIPQKGERFVAQDGTTLEIADASARRVRTVRITRAPASTASA